MVPPDELGFQVQCHLVVGVVIQRIGCIESEGQLPARPEGVTVEELGDGSELRSGGEDGERLLEEEARQAAPLLP
jgi:hypothetical protein